MEFIKNVFGNYVPKFSLYESLTWGILNSEEFKKRNPKDQEKVRKCLGGGSFKRICDNLESLTENPSHKLSYNNDWK